MTITVTLREDKSPELSGINLIFEVVSTEKHRFCIYMTPLEDFAGDILDVQDEHGISMPYLGRMIKRRPPTWFDHTTLYPEKGKLIQFNLAEHYQIPSSGSLSVQFKGRPALNSLPNSNILSIEI